MDVAPVSSAFSFHSSSKPHFITGWLMIQYANELPPFTWWLMMNQGALVRLWVSVFQPPGGVWTSPRVAAACTDGADHLGFNVCLSRFLPFLLGIREQAWPSLCWAAEASGEQTEEKHIKHICFLHACCSVLHIVTKCFYSFPCSLFFFSFQRKGLLMVLFWGPRCVCVIKLLNGFLARTRVVGCCGDAPAQLSSCYQTTKIPNYHIFTRSIGSHTFGIHLPITSGLKRCNAWVLIKNIWYIF